MKELIEIQRALKAPKDQEQKHYKYRKIEDIVSAIKNIASDNVLITLSDQVISVGNRYYVEATATISNGESSVSCKGYAREPESLPGQSSPQVTGSCSTYARKRALEGLTALDNSADDPDLTSKGVTSLQKSQFKDFEAKLKQNNDNGALANLSKLKNNQHLTETEAHNAIININKYIEGKRYE